MVSKTSAGATKKTPAPAKAKKTVAKKATKSVAAKTTAKSKIVNTQVPVKEDINPLEKVMEIKAHNDEKKSSKAAPKKAETKCCCCCKDSIFSSWVSAYKNLFNFKGRASRYEFWGFALMNIFFLLFATGGLFLLSSSTEDTVSISTFGAIAFLILMLVEFFVYLSLVVRRLHDAGYSAWRGFFRPFIISVILCTLFAIGSAYIVETMGSELLNADGLTQTWISCFVFVFIIVLLICMYYGTKIFVVTSFYEEDKEDNEYGEARYTEACYKAKALRYTILHYIIITCMNFITYQLKSYMYLSNGQF